MGIGILQGREFTRQEADRGTPVAVISESTARSLWAPGRIRSDSISLSI